MPWKETCPMDQKMQMMADHISGDYTISELGREYEVSRKTIYKWVKRYQVAGPSGLEERSKAPKGHPNATPVEVAAEIVAAKLRHERWGPRKLVVWLEEHYPRERWPAASTAGEILKREGLAGSRRRRRRTPPYIEPFSRCQRPDAVWSADFKGQFRMGDGKLCYPLTIYDNWSRYILAVRALRHPTLEGAKPWFESVFKEYGLPEAIRTDNGAPFASVGLGGLSRLAVWFIKLGIKPERIEPGHPEQNGRHERMHRTLKEATASPPQSNIGKQQEVFDRFVEEHNCERPHEALGQKTPASFHRPSPRAYPAKAPKVEYRGDVVVRRVRHNGEIRWKGKLVYVSEALAGEPVALKYSEQRQWTVSFRSYLLGALNETTGKITPLPTKLVEEV